MGWACGAGAVTLLRLGAHLSAGAAVLFAAWFLLLSRTEGVKLSLPFTILLAIVLLVAPVAVFVVPAFAAGRASRSFRSGFRAAVWTVIAVVPLTYALWLPEALRRHAADGKTLDGELVAPLGVNLSDAMTVCLGVLPVVGLAFGVVGAAFSARRAIVGESSVVGDPS